MTINNTTALDASWTLHFFITRHFEKKVHIFSNGTIGNDDPGDIVIL
jgi:hypothetical protein